MNDVSHRPPHEGIYRRVTVRTYGDEKFMRLSPLQPSGQTLWLYLLTGPHTGPIPGVFVIGKAAMAEALAWAQNAFDEAFAEVLAEGLVEFDAKTRLWFIPNAIRHNMPQNPNVVRSWRAPWSLLPEGDARNRIAERLFFSVNGLSDAFGKAFEEACGKPLPKASGNHSPKQEAVNSEQETEEETSSSAKPPTLPNCPQRDLIAMFVAKVLELPRPRAEMWGGKNADAMRARWQWVLTATREDGKRYATTVDEATEWFGKFFDRVSASDFLTGRTGKFSGCDLGWLMKHENFNKVVQGNYKNREAV